MPHKDIMMKIGELFLLRTNINSVGSVLDSPVSFHAVTSVDHLIDLCFPGGVLGMVAFSTRVPEVMLMKCIEM
jgi:hypothetical protein